MFSPFQDEEISPLFIVYCFLFVGNRKILRSQFFQNRTASMFRNRRISIKLTENEEDLMNEAQNADKKAQQIQVNLKHVLNSYLNLHVKCSHHKSNGKNNKCCLIFCTTKTFPKIFENEIFRRS